MAAVRIGVSGWTYRHWRGGFYPAGLVQRRELEYASRQMNSVEINGTFYSLQRPASFRKWYEETPPGFEFAVKGGRFITHMKKLNEVEGPLANFFASGVLRLAEKLGPVLWQFPPNLAFDYDRVARFLDLLPENTAEAAALAARHDDRVAGQSWTQAEHDGPIRHAFEVRHPSFFTAAFLGLLKDHGAALVFADTAGTWPYAEDLTADFVYVRLHGAEQLYASGYTDPQLDAWAQKVHGWHNGGEASGTVAERQAAGHGLRDVYVYFDNDIHGHAPVDAIRLAGRLSPGAEPPRG
ncbi:MAG TPA: DUF72 domain-containing protein [Rubricoccaceae bacterium]|jgi:uncharacterized protein YecE (DUF72 family)